jgi:signal transduction histidine kinase
MNTGSAPGSDPIEDDARLWRVVGVFRFAALGYAIALHAAAQDGYTHRWLAWAVLGVLAAWTVFLAVRPGRETVVMVVDLALASGSVLITRVLDDPDRIQAGAQTLPSIWPAAAVLAWAIWRGWRGGLLAAVVIAVMDVAEIGGLTEMSAVTVNNIVLLMLSGLIVGYAVEVLRAGQTQLTAAAAQQAATAERERLARDIHDSVLQVLGFVHRDGTERGGAAADLARMAGEQEARLRALISNGSPAATLVGEADLRAALSRHAGARISISCPAMPVLLPAGQVAALTAATAAALDNVRQHAGEQAQAWVLLEDEPEQVTVTVRDDGPGIEPDRLEAARMAGRLGVSASIRGRIKDIGGTVEFVCMPGEGTEVELRVPRAG